MINSANLTAANGTSGSTLNLGAMAFTVYKEGHIFKLRAVT
jgi:hypothetical protein